MFICLMKNSFLIFLFSVFVVFSCEGLIKVDVAGNIVGGSERFVINGGGREISIRDVAEATVDAVDLLAVLSGIAQPLLNPNTRPTRNVSWLHLPRTKPGNIENLEIHLLRGHGPAGGLSQAHIMSGSVFLSGEIAGIQPPESGIGLAIDPNMPLSRGGVQGGEGKPVNRNWNQLQRDVNSVTNPIRATVISILDVVNSENQVKFQVAPIRGMRKFIIDLNQISLVNCPRPVIYDDQTPIPDTVPPTSEGWLRKTGGRSPWRVSQRAGFIIINLPSRSGMQVDSVLEVLGTPPLPTENSVVLQRQGSAAIVGTDTDDYGRETQRIPVTIYFSR